jgi:hypothetical protein
MSKKVNVTLKATDKRTPSISQGVMITDKLVAVNKAYKEGLKAGRVEGVVASVIVTGAVLVVKYLIGGA